MFIMNTQFRYLRFVIVPLATLFFVSLGYIISLTDDYGRQFVSQNPARIVVDILSSVLYTLFCAEISLRLFRWLQTYFPIETEMNKLIFTHLLLTAFVWVDVFTLSQILIYGYDTSEKMFMIKSNILFALTVTIGMNAVQVGMVLFERWKKQIEETEIAKRGSLEAQNEALKQQIDPHFLFNSLNTLTALIEEEPKLATRFVKELSNVYRYVLQSKDSSVVSLEEELAFLRAYSTLLELRFGANFSVRIDTSAMPNQMGVPPLALQMCIENAVKHNIVSREYPLAIEVVVVPSFVKITNKFQPKRNVGTSTGLGLDNLRHRYSLLTDEQILIEQYEQDFCVTLPIVSFSETPSFSKVQEGVEDRR